MDEFGVHAAQGLGLVSLALEIGVRQSREAPTLLRAPASLKLPPVHNRDRWQEIAASQFGGARRMAAHLADDRGHGEHEAGDKWRPAL